MSVLPSFIASRRAQSPTAHLRHHVLQIALLARQVFRYERVRPRVKDARDRVHGPGLEQHLRIIDRCDPAQRIAVAREALHHLELEAVEVARLVQPALVREADGLDHQRVAFPMADRIALPGLLRDARLVVRPAVGGHDAEGVLPGKTAGIEQHHLILGLHDLRRLAHAWHAIGPALELVIALVAVGVVLAHLGPMFRLVERLVAVAQPAQRIVVLEILEAVVTRSEHGLAALLVVARPNAAHGGNPDACEIRLAVGRARGRRLRGWRRWRLRRLREARDAIAKPAYNRASNERAEVPPGPALR